MSFPTKKMFYTLILFFTFVVLLTIVLLFTLVAVDSGSRSPDLTSCTYDGPNPEPEINEIIGAASDTLLYSCKSTEGYVAPCFVYFGNNITFDVTEYGVKLPAGTYNVYVCYLSLNAVDGEEVSDRLIQTLRAPTNPDILIQNVVGREVAPFIDNKATTAYPGIVVEPGANILRIESSLNTFGGLTLVADRIECLFERLIL